VKACKSIPESDKIADFDRSADHFEQFNHAPGKPR
jgi:hypothetical protein